MDLVKQKIPTLFWRELWENKGTVIWLPVVFAVINLVQNSAGLWFFSSYYLDRFGDFLRWVQQQMLLPPAERAEAYFWGEHRIDMENWEDANVLVALGDPASGMPLAMQLSMLALVLVALVAAISYAHGALINDRKDRSILFWKSLPVSETQSVITKWLFAALAIPLVGLVISLAMSVLMFPLVAYFYASVHEVSFWSMFSHVNLLALLWVNLGVVLGLGIKFSVVFAWILFFSAYAKRAVALYSLLIPVGLAAVEGLTIGTSYIGNFIEAVLFSPGDYWWKAPESFAAAVTQVLSSFSVGQGLVAVLLTAGLLSGAIWLRNYRYEI